MPVSGSQVLSVSEPQVFSCEFRKIFKNTFFIEHLLWLFLDRAKLRAYSVVELSHFGIFSFFYQFLHFHIFSNISVFK